MLKHADPEGTLVGLEPAGELALECEDELSEQPYHWGDDVDELVLLKHEMREMRRELAQARGTLDQTLRLARRRDRLHSKAHAKRQLPTRGSALARGILRVGVAIFTLAGALAGVGVAITATHVWGHSVYATVAAAFFGLAIALGAWLAASLAALVLETADSVRDLP